MSSIPRGREDPLEKKMATHSSILEQEITWTEEPGRPCSPQGHKELDTTKAAEHPRTWVQSIGEYLEKCG